MREDFAPALQPVEIATLRPTQMTVGLREVERKRADWRKHAERDGPDFLGRHMIPVIMGPKGVSYVIDHHHLLRALHDEGVSHVLVSVIADLHYLKKTVFWTFMDNRNWLHPFDVDGRRQPDEDLPKHVGKLKNDPYRSLAGELRRAGGYAKEDTPFSEFLWADFLRHKIARELVEKDFETAVRKALILARKQKAAYLPGWVGPHD